MASTYLNSNVGWEKKNVDISRFIKHDVWDSVEIKKGMQFNREFLRILEEGRGADTTLMASGGSVKAHRLLLAAVSPVFDAMFRWKDEKKDERARSTVDMSDISIEVLQLLLTIFYAYEVPANEISVISDEAVDENFFELFEACNKYLAVNALMSVSKALPRNLTLENCWYYYRRFNSSQYNLQLDMPYPESPAAASKDYILRNLDKLFLSENIISEMKENPETVRELMALTLPKGNKPQLI